MPFDLSFEMNWFEDDDGPLRIDPYSVTLWLLISETIKLDRHLFHIVNNTTFMLSNIK